MTDIGDKRIYAYCPNCGTPIYLTFAAVPDLIAVHATSLGDPGQFNPSAVTYTSRGHVWDSIDSALQAFDKMPTGWKPSVWDENG